MALELRANAVSGSTKEILCVKRVPAIVNDMCMQSLEFDDSSRLATHPTPARDFR